MPEVPRSFIEGLEAMQVALEGAELEQLGLYLDRLYAANARMNLTGVRDPVEAWERHLLDSLSLLPMLRAADAKSVLDLGSGGGLPGFPLAITMPDVSFLLLEATGKKAAFLQEVVDGLELSNVTVLDERAETIGEPGCLHRGAYDAVSARAVGPMNVLLELALPLLRVGGVLLAIKGERASEEIKQAGEALRTLHGRVIETNRTSTGTIVIVEKEGDTPADYPRRPGEPKRLPIGGRSGGSR